MTLVALPATEAHSSGDETSPQRELLLQQAENALAQVDVATALALFERAASMQHRADSELGLVRTYMQDGQYRRALAFVAHTAAAHRDNAGGTLMHAWLLHAGGQPAVAATLLDDARKRWPDDPRVRAVVAQLASVTPLATGTSLHPPTRLAPYGPIRGLAARARIVGTGVLMDDGVRIVVPLAAVTPASALWVRNGIGEASRATIERRYVDLRIAVLRVSAPMRVAPGFVLADRDAFAGSVAYTAEYFRSAEAQPAWPILRAGFVGEVLDGADRRTLAIETSVGGGPVFDRWGRLAGIAIPGERGDRAQLLAASRVRKVADRPKLTGGTPVPRNVTSDEVYEAAMLHAVQVIAASESQAPPMSGAH